MRIPLLIQGILACLLLASGCDGGSGSNSNSGSTGNGNEPPPTSTQTGYLVDAGVSGIRYVTSTHNGVTDMDGAFHYEPGELVSFLIGDTVLGEVAGKAEVTPFDLAGSEPLTGTPTIARALKQESAPFHGVVNIAVLLQSLDHDAEPENGIEITPEVAGMFQGISLNIRQHWDTFESDAALQQVLAKANEQDLFPDNRRTVLPATALQHLYDSRGIDAHTLAVSLSQQDGEEAAGYEYDSEGYLKRMALPHWYMEGDDAQQYLTQDYGYDERGRMTLFEEQSYSEWVGSFFSGSNVLFQYLSISTESRAYTTSGDLAWIERSSGGLVLIDSVEPGGGLGEISVDKTEDWRYQYGVEGKLRQVEVNFPKEGKSCVTEYQYDQQGRLVLVGLEGDRIDAVVATLAIPEIEYLYLAAMSSGSYSVAYEYDADGFLSREVRTGVSPSFGHSVETLHYDTTGKVTFHEARSTSFDFPPDSPEIVTNHQYEYDDRGNQVSHSEDTNGDGVPNRLERWEYDNDGNVTRKEEFNGDGDGTPDYVSQWEYDDDGYLVREDVRFSGVVSYQYAPAGWGHLFTPPPRDPSTQFPL